ncbi:hypothetical protein P5V15_005039 [Pogonomyrmex californicus]
MQSPNIALWCYIFLLVASSTESWGNFINDKYKKNFTMRYDLVNSTIRDDEMPNKIHMNFTKNDRKDSDFEWSRKLITMNFEEDNQTKSRANFTELNDEDNFMLQGINENLEMIDYQNNSMLYEFYDFNMNYYDNKYNNNIIVLDIQDELCDNGICIQFCCPLNKYLTYEGKCTPEMTTHVHELKNDYKNHELKQLLQIFIFGPCDVQGFKCYQLYPNQYTFFNNNIFYQNSVKISSTRNCFTIMKENISFDLIVCQSRNKVPIIMSVGFLVSLPFLLLTFVIYSILPKLQNMHGYTLRAYITSLFVVFLIMPFAQQISDLHKSRYCIPLAYIYNFFFLSCFFWLNVTCFDIWWTFRRLRSINTKHRKKFIIYSIYVWSIAFMVTGICAIMDYYVPDKSKDFIIQPEICKRKFWFSREKAKMLYFFVPTAISVISNICFFIAILITVCQTKCTSYHLRDKENRCYIETMQRFRLFVKLFLVMGINLIISWSFYILKTIIKINDDVTIIFWYSVDMINSLQGLIIFVILVCKKKIILQLLERFGWRGHDLVQLQICEVSSRNNSIVSNTTSFTSRSSMTISQRISSFDHCAKSN